MTTERQKEISIVTIAMLYTVLFFLAIALLLTTEGVGTGIFVSFAGIGGLVWAALMAASFAWLANKNESIMLMAGIPPLVVVLAGWFSLPAFVGAALLWVLLTLAARAIHREMRDRVQFKAQAVFRVGIRLILLGVVISLIALTLPTVQENIANGDLAVSEEYAESIMRPMAPLLSNFFPSYSPSSTVDEIIDAQIAEQVKDLPPGVVVPPRERERIRDGWSQQLGVELTGEETLPEVITANINRYVQNLANGTGIVMTIALIAVVLLALPTLVPVLAWLALPLILLIMYVAKRIGLISVMKTQVTVERIHL